MCFRHVDRLKDFAFGTDNYIFKKTQIIHGQLVELVDHIYNIFYDIRKLPNFCCSASKFQIFQTIKLNS